MWTTLFLVTLAVAIGFGVAAVLVERQGLT
jgi:hypothetical protein